MQSLYFEVDERATSPCKNGASCKLTDDGYSCQPCPAGWMGKDCDQGLTLSLCNQLRGGCHILSSVLLILDKIQIKSPHFRIFYKIVILIMFFRKSRGNISDIVSETDQRVDKEP